MTHCPPLCFKWRKDGTIYIEAEFLESCGVAKIVSELSVVKHIRLAQADNGYYVCPSNNNNKGRAPTACLRKWSQSHDSNKFVVIQPESLQPYDIPGT